MSYGDPDILAAETALLDGLPDLFLVAVYLGSVQANETDLNSCVDVGNGLQLELDQCRRLTSEELTVSLGIFHVPLIRTC